MKPTSSAGVFVERIVVLQSSVRHGQAGTLARGQASRQARREWRDVPEGGRSKFDSTSSFLVLEPGDGPEPDAVVYRRLGDWRGLGRPVLEPPVKVATAKSETIRNAWGDEVDVWRFPAMGFQRMRSFVQNQPVLVAGEFTDSLSFREWDAQFGPSPWNPEGIPEPFRGMVP